MPAPHETLAACAAIAHDESLEHFGYETDTGAHFGVGSVADVILHRDRVHIEVGGVPLVPTPLAPTPLAPRPADTLRAAVAHVEAALDRKRRAFGWIGVEFALPHHDVEPPEDDGTPLAHLRWPETLLHIDADGAVRPLNAGRWSHLFDAASLERALRTLDANDTATTVDVSADDSYRETVARAVAEIRAGDYEKVIISRRVVLPTTPDLAATYLRGRRSNTPARSFVFELPGLGATGFSPELVVAVDADGVVTTEPLAGTRARTGDPDIDGGLREELRTDPKEIVEHAISVRDAVTEVGRVADGIRVDEFMAIRERGSVQHLASTVRGTLHHTSDRFDALAELFPAVTASGIPKGPALAAILRLEPVRRGLYSGAVITLGTDGDLETALCLRTLYSDGVRAWLQAGAGIVDASDPEREFTETCEKLASVAPYVVPASVPVAARA